MAINQVGNALTFYFFYEDSANLDGETGLTVTVDVYEGTTQAPIVTAGNASELAGGLYYYTLASGSVDAQGAYLAMAKTTSADVVQKWIPAIWSVWTSGAPVNTVANADKTDYSISGTLTTLDAIWTKIQKWLRLALRKDAATATDCATELTELNADGGSGAGAYANTSDAQEATRDQGDSAWITAVGFNTTVPDAAGTAASLVSDLQTHGDSEWATAVGFNTVEPDPAGTAGTLIGDLETHGDGAWATATGFNTTTPDAAGTAATLVSNLQTHGDSEWATADVSGLSTFAPGTDEMESGITWTEFARALGAVLGGVASGGGTTTVVFKALDDSDTTRVTATVDEDGNRSVVTLTLS